MDLWIINPLAKNKAEYLTLPSDWQLEPSTPTFLSFSLGLILNFLVTLYFFHTTDDMIGAEVQN